MEFAYQLRLLISLTFGYCNPAQSYRDTLTLQASHWEILVEAIMHDTSPKVREVYFRRLAEMTPSERLGIGVALWRAGDSLQRAAIRRAYPLAGDAEISFRIAVTRFGAELAHKAY